MDKNDIIAESFGQAIAAGFNEYLEKNATSENTEIKVDEDALVADISEKWLKKKIPEAENITPLEYIDSLTSLNALIALFKCIAAKSDVGVPGILIDRLKGYGKTAADMLFSFVQSSLDSRDEDNILAVAEAVYAIGRFKYEEYKTKLIGLLIENCRNELIAEAICSAIIQYDKEILEDLMKTFHASNSDQVQEFLLICIAEITKEYKSDEVFQFLKNAFRVVSNLKMAVEILGDYGDSRAIPMLRGYVLKNIKDLDKSTFNNIRAVIKKLGGEINDLTYTQK